MFAFLTGERDGIPIGTLTAMPTFYVVPRGMERMIMYYKERYNNTPMFITENGYAQASSNNNSTKDFLNDIDRIHYLSSYLASMKRAIRRQRRRRRGRRGRNGRRHNEGGEGEWVQSHRFHGGATPFLWLHSTGFLLRSLFSVWQQEAQETAAPLSRIAEEDEDPRRTLFATKANTLISGGFFPTISFPPSSSYSSVLDSHTTRQDQPSIGPGIAFFPAFQIGPSLPPKYFESKQVCSSPIFLRKDTGENE